MTYTVFKQFPNYKGQIKDYMDTKETPSKTVLNDRMIEDNEFYKYIFKKTEKIVCAVFYILNTDTYKGHNESVITDAEQSAKALLESSLICLKGTRSYTDIYARDIQHALITLESRLRIAHASRVLKEGYLEVFIHELDTVQRTLRKYIDSPSRNPLLGDEGLGEVVPKERRVLQPKRVETRLEGGAVIQSQGRTRNERILDIIKDKGEATIKDISSIITDCSEKTIQRELIDMIKDNKILREGERRWSKYRLV